MPPQARLLVGVATADTEDDWLALAEQRTVRALEALIRGSRAAPAGEDDEPRTEFRLRCPRRILVLWRDTAGYYVYSSPAVADGVVCWGSYTGWFYGSSAATGHDGPPLKPLAKRPLVGPFRPILKLRSDTEKRCADSDKTGSAHRFFT